MAMRLLRPFATTPFICNISHVRTYQLPSVIGMCPERIQNTVGSGVPSNRYANYGTLTHSDEQGKAKMVDVSEKIPSKRQATAVATVSLQEDAFKLVRENQLKKGDVLTVATLAGVMGAKECHRLIPLCHHVSLSNVNVNLSLNDEDCSVKIEGTVVSVGQTGVEMEALTAVSIAALTVYDMCKGVTQNIIIEDVKLIEKMGGKSGHYHRK